jgi:hypothetical protein
MVVKDKLETLWEEELVGHFRPKRTKGISEESGACRRHVNREQNLQNLHTTKGHKSLRLLAEQSNLVQPRLHQTNSMEDIPSCFVSVQSTFQRITLN